MNILGNDVSTGSSGAGHAASAAASMVTPECPDGAGFCEISCTGIIRVSGPDAASFLQGQFTNDVLSLAIGSSQYSAWCSPKGRMLANFVVVRAEPATFDLLLDISLVQAIRKRLAMFVLRSKVVVADVSEQYVRFGVGGADASSMLERATGASMAPAVHRLTAIEGAHALGLPGHRFMVIVTMEHVDSIRQQLARVLHAITLEQWQWLTIIAGVPVITAVTTDLFVPQTANWDVLEGINFQKGCYAGQEIVARTQYLGRLKERLFLAHVDAPHISAGDRIYSSAFPDQPSGTVVNAAAALTGGIDLLAVLQLASAASGDLHVGSVDGPPAHRLNLPYSLPEPVAPRGRIA